MLIVFRHFLYFEEDRFYYTNMNRKYTKLLRLLKKTAPKKLVIWNIFAYALLFIFYKIVLEKTNHIFPDLGAARKGLYGNTVIHSSIEKEGLRIRFAPVPITQHIGGGVFWQNWFTTAKEVIPVLPAWPFFTETIIEDANYVIVRIKGKVGGEKIELKLRNHKGEGTFILGTPPFFISNEFQEISIPLSEFEYLRGTLGSGFDRRDGLDAIVIGIGSALDIHDQTEVTISQIKINNLPRKDGQFVFLVLISLSVFFYIFRLLYHITIFLIKQNSITIFISYSHKDTKYREELEKHLSTLRRQGLISTWHDRKITPGMEWAKEVDKNLNVSRIILLIITSNFIASNYCFDIEMKKAMEKHKSGKARVIPIIAEHCDWHGLEFSNLEALPTKARPIQDWGLYDEAYTDIAKGIRKVVRELTKQRD